MSEKVVVIKIKCCECGNVYELKIPKDKLKHSVETIKKSYEDFRCYDNGCKMGYYKRFAEEMQSLDFKRQHHLRG